MSENPLASIRSFPDERLHHSAGKIRCCHFSPLRPFSSVNGPSHSFSRAAQLTPTSPALTVPRRIDHVRPCNKGSHSTSEDRCSEITTPVPCSRANIEATLQPRCFLFTQSFGRYLDLAVTYEIISSDIEDLLPKILRLSLTRMICSH